MNETDGPCDTDGFAPNVIAVYGDWHVWFAWYPVLLGPPPWRSISPYRRIAWLKRIQRRYVRDWDSHLGGVLTRYTEYETTKKLFEKVMDSRHGVMENPNG